MSDNEDDSAPVAAQRRKFQISISTMLMLMIVFSVMSAGIYHASRVPAITRELEIAFGWEVNEQGNSRVLQIIFIMFTYSMPLAMAGLLSTFASLWNWYQRRSSQR